MGQKVKPIGLRVGINRTWDSRWYAGRNYGQLLHEDLQVRGYLMDRLKQAAISRVMIERPAGRTGNHPCGSSGFDYWEKKVRTLKSCGRICQCGLVARLA